jgi:phosphate transport system permease protein
MISRKLKQRIALILLRIPPIIVALVLFAIIGYLIAGGIGAISLDFILQFPKEGMTAGGIFPAIIGTLILMILTVLFAVPLGIFASIYLSEYTRREGSLLIRTISIATNVLAGVPSIVYGLLGLGLFVLFLNLGFSLISSALTLSFLTLPIILAASEEALKSVPMNYREAALALGATKWQMIKLAVLPYALPGIMTSVILGLSRAAGETAPILLTGVVYFLTKIPSSITDQFMALPFHIYALSTQSINPELTRPLQFGTVLVLLLMVLGMNSVAILIRIRSRRMRK